jgi:secreted trypsin-like serine protease
MQLRAVSLAALFASAVAGCATDLPTSNLGAPDAGPQFITHGSLDGETHPHVGLMIAKNAAGAPMWRCSGTLLSPTLFLTAGHCTEAPAARVEIWFAADVQSGRPGNGYPFSGEVGGTPYTHPDYNPSAFYLADVGVVVLDEPVIVSRYGLLPELNSVESLARQRGLQNTTFRAVGYGLQRINPVFVESQLIRMVATPHLVQINTGLTGSFSLLLSNNAATGGTCYGDSGGPNFLGDTDIVAGVTSFGINGNCAGTGGVYRMDRAAPLSWIQSTFGAHLD